MPDVSPDAVTRDPAAPEICALAPCLQAATEWIEVAPGESRHVCYDCARRYTVVLVRPAEKQRPEGPIPTLDVPRARLLAAVVAWVTDHPRATAADVDRALHLVAGTALAYLGCLLATGQVACEDSDPRRWTVPASRPGARRTYTPEPPMPRETAPCPDPLDDLAEAIADEDPVDDEVDEDDQVGEEPEDEAPAPPPPRLPASVRPSRPRTTEERRAAVEAELVAVGAPGIDCRALAARVGEPYQSVYGDLRRISERGRARMGSMPLAGERAIRWYPVTSGAKPAPPKPAEPPRPAPAPAPKPLVPPKPEAMPAESAVTDRLGVLLDRAGAPDGSLEVRIAYLVGLVEGLRLRA